VNDPRFEVYPQKASADGGKSAEPTGEFGWRFRAANGQITAIGGESFTRREDARRAVKDFVTASSALAPRFGDHDEPILDLDD
jgi:uncharacterized protein YegP (UPF0339 family)